MYYHGPWVTKYLKALAREVEEKYEGEEIKTLYIGGGTPSSLSLKDIKYLFEIVGKFKLSHDCEVSFECNLNDINEELLRTLKDCGVNRLSIGIESFNEEKLKFMERSHTYDEAVYAMKLARYYGFNNINVDLMYGIPGETLKDLKKDLELLLELKPDHISTYSLIVEDHTKVGNMGIVPIPEELDASMYELICDKLKKEKFIHYEVSNFSIDGKQSKHNLTYWNNNEYYGFGMGASGYIHGVRYENTKTLNDYFEGKWVKSQEMLGKEDIMYNELMLGFRKMEGINLREFYDKYKVNMQEVFDLREVLREKELLVKDEYIFVNPEYIYVMNEILIKII
jgi:oxygen-independent coproporphyrinogen-3 oxidase